MGVPRIVVGGLIEIETGRSLTITLAMTLSSPPTNYRVCDNYLSSSSSNSGY